VAPGAWQVTRSSNAADDWRISFALSVSKIWTNIDSRNVSHSITCNILQYLTIWINCCTTCRHLAYSAWTCPAQGGLSPGSATQWDEKRTVTVRYEHNSYSKCFRYVLVALNGCKMLAFTSTGQGSHSAESCWLWESACGLIPVSFQSNLWYGVKGTHSCAVSGPRLKYPGHNWETRSCIMLRSYLRPVTINGTGSKLQSIHRKS